MHAGTARLEVIVVDNESTDGTREFIESSFRTVRVVSSRNGGFGYANNRGWENADARYALFLNPDTEIVAGTFGELVEAIRHTPSLSSDEAKALIESEKNLVVLDARRFEEYRTMSIPRGISVLMYLNSFVSPRHLTALPAASAPRMASSTRRSATFELLRTCRPGRG